MDKSRKKDAVKKVIAAMTVGKDVSPIFPDVVNCMQTDDLELKKLVYLYLINYAKSQPDLAIMAVNTFVKVRSTALPPPLPYIISTIVTFRKSSLKNSARFLIMTCAARQQTISIICLIRGQYKASESEFIFPSRIPRTLIRLSGPWLYAQWGALGWTRSQSTSVTLYSGVSRYAHSYLVLQHSPTSD